MYRITLSCLSRLRMVTWLGLGLGLGLGVGVGVDVGVGGGGGVGGGLGEVEPPSRRCPGFGSANTARAAAGAAAGGAAGGALRLLNEGLLVKAPELPPPPGQG